MGKVLNIIDIVTSAMNPAGHTLESMSGIVLEEMPLMRREEVPAAAIYAPEGVYAPFVVYSQSVNTTKIKGAVVIYVSKTNLSTVFGSLGMSDLSPDPEIRDACGEFCNIVAGVFKTEIVHLGYEDVQLSVPEKYSDDIGASLRGLTGIQRYKLSFSYKGRGVISIEVFMGTS
jgi:hypothetical protein